MSSIFFTLLGLVLHFTHGHFHPEGLLAVSFLFVSLAVSFFWPIQLRLPFQFQPPLKTLAFIQTLFVCYSAFILYPTSLGGTMVLYGGVFAALFFVVLNRWVNPIFVVTALAISKAAVIFASPEPAIDVWYWNTQAVDYFLSGVNPYSAQYVDLSSATYGYKGVYSYGPLLLYLLAPFRALHLDIRWLLWIMDLLTAWSVLRITRNSWWSILWFSWPVSWFLLEQAWVDGVMIGVFALATVILLGEQKRLNLFAFVLALSIGLKQYAMFLILILYFAHWKKLSGRERLRVFGIGLGTGVILYLPYWIANPQALYHSLVGMYASIPIRLDAMTWRALWAQANGGVDLRPWLDHPTVILGTLTIACVLAWQLSSRKDNASLGYVLALGVFGLVCLFGTHSFCNQYHYLGFLGFFAIITRIKE